MQGNPRLYFMDLKNGLLFFGVAAFIDLIPAVWVEAVFSPDNSAINYISSVFVIAYSTPNKEVGSASGLTYLAQMWENCFSWVKTSFVEGVGVVWRLTLYYNKRFYK
jgi:hypothetical protein